MNATYLARGDAGRETAERQWLDATPVLRDVAEQATSMGAAKTISVSLQLDAEGLPVRANETRLRRLLLILVDKARTPHRSPAHGYVHSDSGAPPKR